MTDAFFAQTFSYYQHFCICHVPNYVVPNPWKAENRCADFLKPFFGDLECVYLAWHVVSRFLIPNKWVVISLGVLYIWRNNSRPGLTWNLRCFLLNEAHQQINMLGLANTKLC